AAIEVNWTASGTITTPVVLDLQYDPEIFSRVDSYLGDGPGKYIIKYRTKSGIGVGKYTANISYRLCHQAACSNVYAGSSKSYRLNIEVKDYEWTTFQGNNRRTGYVPVQVDVTKFEK